MNSFNKRRWQLLFGALLLFLSLLWGYDIFWFNQDTSSPPTVATISSRTPLAKNTQLAWPAAGQAAVGSIEDGVLTRSSNNEEQRPTASMAKIITALAVLKKQPLNPGQTGPSYIITGEDVANYHAYVARDGSTVPVHEGMVLTQYQALQAMLIPSANNIAQLLAERTFGSEEAYISYAKSMLRNMGLNQTIVTDASGFNVATISTPSELVKIGITALKNPIIAEIVAQSQAQIPGIGTIKNTNELLGADGVVGIKTGTTDSAGSCLLFAAHYVDTDNRTVTIVGVIMGDTSAENLFSDSRTLLASARQAYGLTSSHSTDTTSTISKPQRTDQAPR